MTAPVELDLKFFHCEERSAAPTNGGRLSVNEILTGVMNNVWPSVLRSQREAGDKLFRKIGLKIHQDGNGTLATTEFVIDGPTLGDDRCVMFGGTATDTQADIVDVDGDRLSSIRFFCSGGLVSPVTAGSSTAVFSVKDAGDLDGIQVGDDFRIADKVTPVAVTGNIEYHTVATKSVSGLNITITTERPFTYGYAAYSAGTGGKIGAIYKAGVTAASHGTIVKTSSAGVFDYTTTPLEWNNQGADEHQLTLDLTDATHFIGVSNRFGNLATGVTTADYAPLHPTWGKPLVTIPLEVWGGTFTGGDSIVIPLHAAASFIWQERNVPAGCAPLSANRIWLVNRSEGQ